MISYSLTANTQISTGLIDRQKLMESKLENFWRSSYGIDQIDDYVKLVCEGDLLLEFSLKDFIVDNLSNLLQTAIGAALEGGISIGTLGAGAPAGIAAEAINDLIFFGSGVADFVMTAKGIFGDLMELKDLLIEIFSSTIEDEPQDIYDMVQTALSGAGELIERLGFDFDEMMEKLTNAFRKLLVKVAKPAGDMVAIFVPIPGVDIIVQNLITEFSDDAFKTFIEYYDKIPEFLREMIHDTDKLQEFVDDGLDTAIEFLEKMITPEESDGKGFFEKAISFVSDSPLELITKYSGAGEKIIDFLNSSARKAIAAAIDMIQKIYPILVAGLSAITIITNEDY